MKIFLDANVLVSVLNKEYPLFTYSSRILSLASHPKFDVYTSPLCLAIAFYFAEKKHKSQLAKQKIDLLCQHIKIAENLSRGVSETLSNKSIHDFEDGLEYYAAESVDCKCIITEDIEDFYFSDIEVLNCQAFFKRYLLN
ncbi:PIN domain-containing protein [Pedobacter fastidiosus]|uniref:PIN domain-containing protein n=1 Tax=Pedobacter fastidiosus TaxID=2765361 RepID=A0ABR7KMJ0_9SPHI|nr:PIN domain-containing protein [Pedobacter fastidiosus]MBC6109289.1 PIN domain-containing protein [Pedobacter fastidiosus]